MVLQEHLQAGSCRKHKRISHTPEKKCQRQVSIVSNAVQKLMVLVVSLNTLSVENTVPEGFSKALALIVALK